MIQPQEDLCGLLMDLDRDGDIYTLANMERLVAFLERERPWYGDPDDIEMTGVPLGGFMELVREAEVGMRVRMARDGAMERLQKVISTSAVDRYLPMVGQELREILRLLKGRED